MGRPTKRTPEVEERIFAALRNGNTKEAAAALAGVSERTMYEWQSLFPRFAQAIKEAESEAQETLLAHIRRAANEGMTVTRKDGEVVVYPGSWQAAAWMLERRWPQHFARRERVDMTVDVRKAAERLAADLDGVTADELIATAERIANGREP